MKRNFSLLLLALLMVGCGQNARPSAELSDHKTESAIYHWKTSYNPTDFEKSFMTTHNVNRLYLRMFDVDYTKEWLDTSEEVTPIATTTFKQTPSPELEVVPTVYITLEALRHIQNLEEEYALNIFRRLEAMMIRHELTNVKRIQIDCDWTASTRSSYFKLLGHIKKWAKLNDLKVSATIRLHQLLEDAPPVDEGVLMLYNTGAIESYNTENSILSLKAAEPYIKRCEGYDLPLDFAYPTFSWSVWFRNTKFMALLRNIELDNTTYYEPIGNNKYRVKSDHYVGKDILKEGDIIRRDESNIDHVLEVKKLVEEKFGSGAHSPIIYHLDSTNLSKYSNDEIRAIYSKN